MPSIPSKAFRGQPSHQISVSRSRSCSSGISQKTKDSNIGITRTRRYCVKALARNMISRPRAVQHKMMHAMALCPVQQLLVDCILSRRLLNASKPWEGFSPASLGSCRVMSINCCPHNSVDHNRRAPSRGPHFPRDKC